MNFGRTAAIGLMAATCACAPDIYSAAGHRKLLRVSSQIDTLEFDVAWRNESIWSGIGKVSRAAQGAVTFTTQAMTDQQCPDRPNHDNDYYQGKVAILKWGGNANDPASYKIQVDLDGREHAAGCTQTSRVGERAFVNDLELQRGRCTTLKGEKDLLVRVCRR